MRKQRPACVQCGKPMAQRMTYTAEKWDSDLHAHIMAQYGEKAFSVWLKKQRIGTGTYGYGGNGWFCSKACAFVWAVNRLGARS